MTGRVPHFTVQQVWPRPWDQAWPNITVSLLTPVVVTRLPFFNPISEHPPPPLSPPADFQFANVALQAFAQSRVHPVGAALDETVPSPQAHPVDFQFANVAALNRAQSLVFPIGEQSEDVRPAPPIRQLDFQFPNLVVTTTPIVNQTFDHVTPPTRVVDFQFPNVALQAFAQSRVQPVGEMLDETVPTPPPHQVDFQFPNLLTTTMAPVFEPSSAEWGPWPQPPVHPQDVLPPNLAVLGVVVVTKPVVPTAFDRPQQITRQLDFQFPNLAVFLRPTVNLISDRPPLAARPFDIQFPNIPVLNAAQRLVFPVGKALDESAPAPQTRQLDFAFRNVALRPTVGVPVFNPDFSAPAPTARQLDFQFRNTVVSYPFVVPDLTKLFRPPLITRQAPIQRLADFQPPNIANQPIVIPPDLTKLFRPPLITRPVATQLRVDAPIPNLLTTTLSVAPQKPPFNLIIERPAVPVQPQDAEPVNLLPTLLQTVHIKPVVPPEFTDRPSPTALPVDFQFPNLVLSPTLVARSPLVVRQSPAYQTTPQDYIYNNLLLALQTPPGIPRRPNPYLFTDRPAPAAPSWDQAPPNNTILLPKPVTPVGLHQNPMFTTMGRLSQLGNLPS